MSGILTSGDLAMIQSQAEQNLLPDTCLILRATPTTTSQGGQSLSWATLASGVACLVDVGAGGNEYVSSADRVTPSAGALVAVPFDQDVTEKDRIQVSTLTGGTRTFEVTGVQRDSWLMLTNCACEEQA